MRTKVKKTISNKPPIPEKTLIGIIGEELDDRFYIDTGDIDFTGDFDGYAEDGEGFAEFKDFSIPSKEALIKVILKHASFQGAIEEAAKKIAAHFIACFEDGQENFEAAEEERREEEEREKQEAEANRRWEQEEKEENEKYEREVKEKAEQEKVKKVQKQQKLLKAFSQEQLDALKEVGVL